MKQHILVIGAGFGGMWTALSATRLVDIHNRDNCLLYTSPSPRDS